MRKYHQYLYVILITIITGAVFLIGCGGGGSSSGGNNNSSNNDRNLGTFSTATNENTRNATCSTWGVVNFCSSTYITGPSGGIYTCWGRNCQ